MCFLGYFDVGYISDSAAVVTEIIVRCGNPVDHSAVDIAVSVEMVNSGNPFCPEAYPFFVGPVANEHGKNIESRG